MTEETQTFTYEEPQNTEVLNEDEQDSLEVGERMEAEQEQLLAGKYKDPKDLETAYKELEKKLGEKSEPNSPKEEPKNEHKDEGPKEYDNLLDQLWDEGTNSKLTPETFEKLKGMDPIEVAKMAMQQRQKGPVSRDFTDNDVKQIHGLVGGADNYKQMMGWATQNLSDQEVNMYDAVMDKGDPISAYFAVQAMALRMQDSVGKDGQLVRGKAPKQTSDVFNSQAEMVKAMEDPRYNDDPAYREAILQKLERSNINF